MKKREDSGYPFLKSGTCFMGRSNTPLRRTCEEEELSKEASQS
jgi:hypothetical protein